MGQRNVSPERVIGVVSRSRRGLLGALIIAVAMVCQAEELVADAASVLNGAASQPTVAYVALSLNGLVQPTTIAVLLDEPQHRLWLNEADIRRLRLRLPVADMSLLSNGQRFYTLASIVNAQFDFDSTTQTIAIKVPPEAFEADQSLGINTASLLQPSKRGYSAFLTYDVYAERSDSRTNAGGIFDLEASTPAGLLSSTQFVAQGGGLVGARNTRARRLDTTFTVDYLEHLVSLRVGDFVANGVAGSSPARMAGIQIASNFTVRPGFVTYPLSSIGGQATLPSVAELFVNGASAGTQNVAPGPFTINNVPLINGAGEVRLVVRDVLGREQVITSSFYGSNQLLAPGLSDYSVSVGRLRYNYGTESNDYRDWVGSGYWRYGVTPLFTSNINADTSKRITNAGAGFALLLPAVAEVNASAIASRINVNAAPIQTLGPAQKKSGYATLIAADRRTPDYGIGASLRYASTGFLAVADGNAQLDGFVASRSRRDFNVYASVSAGSLGAFTGSYLSQLKEISAGSFASPSRQSFVNASAARTRDMRIVALGYNVSLNRAGQIAIGASRSIERNDREPKSTSVYVNYFLPLDASQFVSLSTTRSESVQPADSERQGGYRNSSSTQLLTAQRSLPEGEGYGYRVQVGNGSLLRLEGKAALRAATIELDYSQNRSTRGVRVGASGALSTVDGSINASRRITDSFIVVDTGGFSHVRVYLDNNLVGLTNDSGRLLLPSISSYQPHSISIDANDLPLSTEVDKTKINVVTTRSSGAALSFPLRLSRGAQIRLQDERGVAIPVGAEVTLNGGIFPVASEGEVFLLGLEIDNELAVKSGSKTCRVRVKYVASKDLLPHLGAYVCQLQ